VRGFSGAVLAGGRGRRFGRPKADLPWGEGTLGDNAAAVLGGLFDEVLVVGGQARHARRVEDVHPRRGPLGGLYAALLAAGNPYVFVTGCDLPFLNATLIRRLCEEADGFEVVVPESSPGYLEPLHAVYARSCLPLIARQLEQGELRLSCFFGRTRLKVVGPAALAAMGKGARDFFNINTPEDYELALRLRGGGP